ncbi:MAG: FAD-binding protein [Planctomycetia bacterium]|nr:FAD-binding protein [Planctomycetia bacterium]
MRKYSLHTLILGSGAAGLAAALRLKAEGLDDILVLTEGLNMGTSINTGSDKQTYYKMGMYGSQPDSLEQLAQTYLSAGGMNGDLALVEAALSTRAFFHLANLGVPFPHDRFGEYIGYKTDHDPFRRATSCGPYTSREMCRALIAALKKEKIPILENRVALKLLTLDQEGQKRICGLLAVDRTTGEMETFQVENLIFAVGGPGGLYSSSVYPAVHTGAIGLALEIGAAARGLPESQFGISSSTDISDRIPKNSDSKEDTAPVSVFRWNISGTFMQVLPRFISTEKDGTSDPSEFLRPYFSSPGEMNSRVFLKGYQWPFDVRKADGGSSLIDLIVSYEILVKNRRVFLDFRSNPADLDFNDLDPEAFEYLKNSDALFGTPLERLLRMNPGAVELYRDHYIDLAKEPLEIFVSAQHNNGGLAGNIWYESTNIAHLFPIGEVNGSHGIARPGGSALNAGQVGAFRAAEYIAHQYREKTLDLQKAERILEQAADQWIAAADRIADLSKSWRSDRMEFQRRMSQYAAHFRSEKGLKKGVQEAWNQYESLRNRISPDENESGKGRGDRSIDPDSVEYFRNLQLCLAHAVYLDAILFQIESGTGSRGSGLVFTEGGKPIHPLLPPDWTFQPEDPSFRSEVLNTSVNEMGFFDSGTKEGTVEHRWDPCKPIPIMDEWFENVWRDYRENEIFGVE